MTKIVIATPAYGEIFYKPYVQSILRLQRQIDRRQWKSSFVTVSYAEISESRNFLLSHWFNKTDATHILFVDSDMGFDPKLIFDMVDFNKPVVGVIAPKRKIDLERVAALSAKGEPKDQAIAKGHEFIIRRLKGSRVPIEKKGFIQVEACGAGILLIQRSCIELMLSRIPDLSDSEAPKYSPVAAGLDRLIRAFDAMTINRIRLSEDYSFCHRWHSLCQGEIWANVSYEITHTGHQQFKGRYADVMPTGPRVSIAKGKVVKGSLAMPSNGAGKAPTSGNSPRKR